MGENKSQREVAIPSVLGKCGRYKVLSGEFGAFCLRTQSMKLTSATTQLSVRNTLVFLVTLKALT